MAGIGFELRKTLESQTLSAYFSAYMSALAYASGPWICTIIALGAIVHISKWFLPVVTVEQFTVTTVYIYAFSLLLSGPFQIVTTRFVSDRIYEEKEALIPSGIVTSLTFVTVLSVLIGTIASYFSSLPVSLEFAAVILFTIVCALWMIMSYISCLKNYRLITFAFAAGMIVSAVASLGLARFAPHPLVGLMAGYATGHFVILFILLFASFKEFEGDWWFSSGWLKYFRLFPVLAACGFLTNLAIWVDKFIIWYYKGTAVWGVFFFYPSYDIPAYVAYLTAIPSTAFFLIKVETEFSLKYDAFIQSLLHAPSVVINKKKKDMVSSLRDGLVQLLSFQGVITLVVLLVAPSILKILHLGKFSVVLFSTLIVAAYFHFAFLHITIFLMYFDKQRTLLKLLMAFTTLSGMLTAVAADRGNDNYLAVGYLIAAAVSAVLGYYMLFRSIRDIDGDIIFSQPLLNGRGDVIEIRNTSESNSGGRVLLSRPMNIK